MNYPWYPKGIIWKAIKILFTKIFILTEKAKLCQERSWQASLEFLRQCVKQKAAPPTTTPLCMPRAG